VITVDPELAELLVGMAPTDLRDVATARRLSKAGDAKRPLGGPWPCMVTDRQVVSPLDGHEISVRLYEPEAARYSMARRAASLPLIVYFHGGAFVLGDLSSEQGRCLRYACEVGCIVLSIGYRLAPEHPYPAAIEDGAGALGWALEHAGELGIDAGRIAIAGASAGGGLAAGLALWARDHEVAQVAFQLLLYPTLDDRLETDSMHQFHGTAPWDQAGCAQMWELFLNAPREERSEVPAYAAPSRAVELSGLPPAYLMACELDPLRDEVIDYARRLSGAGVSTELRQFAGVFHGFEHDGAATAIGRRALAEQVAVLRRALGAGQHGSAVPSSDLSGRET
jgi:acetyl esterase/lipase